MDMMKSVNELTILVNKLDRLTRLKEDIILGRTIGAYFEIDGMAMYQSDCSYNGEPITFNKELFKEYINNEIKLTKIKIDLAIDVIKEM